jgi:hypothetical protein
VQGQNITAGVMAKNLNAFYKITTPTGVVWVTSKNATVTHSIEKKLIDWSIEKLLWYSLAQKYCFEKVFNVVCLDGHEKDPLIIEEPKKKEVNEKPKRLSAPKKRKEIEERTD